MRKTLTYCICLLALGGLALGQGAGGGSGKGVDKKPVSDFGLPGDIGKDVFSGPGYVQDDFLKTLNEKLDDSFGDSRCEEMWSTFQKQDLDGEDLTKLMNGDATKSGLRDLFGARGNEVLDVQKCLDGAVKDKDRKIFFGILIVIMVGPDFGVEPDSEFCQQCCGARDEMDEELFGKLTKGNMSRSTLQDCFGLGKDDAKFMQDIMKQMMQSPMLNHPMCQSLGMGQQGKFDPSQFPTLDAGMPGGGSGFGGGMAGGMPFDQSMPPLPFMGSNMNDYFKKDLGKGGKGG